jgi:hypothetical protein
VAREQTFEDQLNFSKGGCMGNRRGNLGRQASRRFKREGKGIARGLAREGKKIVTGAVKGFLNAFNPFR